MADDTTRRAPRVPPGPTSLADAAAAPTPSATGLRDPHYALMVDFQTATAAINRGDEDPVLIAEWGRLEEILAATPAQTLKGNHVRLLLLATILIDGTAPCAELVRPIVDEAAAFLNLRSSAETHPVGAE